LYAVTLQPEFSSFAHLSCMLEDCSVSCAQHDLRHAFVERTIRLEWL
jgi:hypothetical protein